MMMKKSRVISTRNYLKKKKIDANDHHQYPLPTQQNDDNNNHPNKR